MKKSILVIGGGLLIAGLFVAVFSRQQPPGTGLPASSNTSAIASITNAPVTPAQTYQPGAVTAATPTAPKTFEPNEIDPKINPYASALREPGKSKRAWDVDFISHYQNAVSGDPIDFELTAGKKAVGVIRITELHEGKLSYMSGELTQPEVGTFFFSNPPEPGRAGKCVGMVEFPSSKTAYRIEPTGNNGDPELWQRRLDEVICVEMPPVQAADVDTNQVEEASPLRPDQVWMNIPSYNTNMNGVAIVSLQSNPGSKSVILLDFFGGATARWGGINYSVPSGANNNTIRDVWKRVAEDYMPFNINVTTDIKVYQAAPSNSRQRCCFTDTPVTAAGVAHISSWSSGIDDPCWAVYTTGKSAAEVAAHECGHTLGLGHMTQELPIAGTNTTTHNEYYAGHNGVNGCPGWAPIMGAGYYQNVVTWSKGEFQYASYFQDEVTTIQGNLNVAYRTDDTGNILASSRYLEIYPDSSVFAEGVIERKADTDAFQFTTTGGQVALAASPVGDWANLAVMVSLYDASDVLIATNNPQTMIAATISKNLAAGTYTFRVTGMGRNSPSNTGFSDYASLGYYSIAGSVVGARQPTRLEVMEHSTNGTTLGTILSSDPGSPLAYAVLSGNLNNTFSVDTNGVVSVANNASLDYATLATNTMGTVQYELFVNITNLNNPALTELNRRVVVGVLNASANNPIPVTGFNKGVIVPYNATTASPKAVGFDVPNNWCFYQAGLSGNTQVGGSGGLQGLPARGSFSSFYDNSVFRFGPYGGANVLLFGYGGNPSSGTLTFTTPKAYSSIAILSVSANGGGVGSLVINFTDGTHSKALNYNGQDWFNVVANVALQGFGRLQLGQSTLSTEDSGGVNPNFYQTTINLGALGLNQAISSITFTTPPLSGSQSSGIFAVSGIPMQSPVAITTQPLSQTNNTPLQAVTFTSAASGTGPFGWQWYFSPTGTVGTYSSLINQTNASLVLSAEVQPSSIGSYFAVVTNSSSAATSSVASLTLFRAPVITRQPAPTNLALFVGQFRAINVAANAAIPVTYYWMKDGSAISINTSSNYPFASLQTANTGNYSVILSNSYGTATSSVVSLTVVEVPINSLYASSVLTDKPIGFWRLNETSGTVARDSIGGNDGVYNSATLNQTGYNPADTDKATSFGPGNNSYVGGIPVDFGTNANRDFSVELWVKGNAQTSDAGILTRGTGGAEQFNLDTGAPNHGFRFYVRDSFGNVHKAEGNVVPNGAWHHLVGVCDKTSLQVVLYVDGVSNASGTISVGSGVLKSSAPMTIGARQSGALAFDYQFVGTIDDVAVYSTALTAAQVKAHYNSVTSMLGILTQPANQSVILGETAHFSVMSSGAQPFGYQWWAGNGTVLSKIADGVRYAGTTTSSLTVTSVASTYATNYMVVVTNSYGAITSSIATLTIVNRPAIVLTNSDVDSPFVSSFISKGNWNDSLAPTSPYLYIVSNSLAMRTPNTSANVTFGGYALTVAGSGSMICKSSANGVTLTVGTNAATGLTLDTGKLQSVDSGKAYTLAGYLNLGSGGGTIDPYDGTVTVASQINGAGSLTVSAAATSLTNGTVVLTASNSFSGGVVIRAADTLRLSGSGTLGLTRGSLQFLNSGGKGFGTLDLNGTSQGVGNLSGTGGTILNNAAGTSSTLTIGTLGLGGGNFQGGLADGAGTLALTKTAGGYIALSGINTYTGPTLVEGGILAFYLNGAIKNSSSITVSNATFELSWLTVPFVFPNTLSLSGSTLSQAYPVVLGGVSLNNSVLLLQLNAGAATNLTVGSLTASGSTNYVQITTLPAVSNYLTSYCLIKYSNAAGIVDANNNLTNIGALLPSVDGVVSYLTNNVSNHSLDLVMLNLAAAPVTMTNLWNGQSLNLSWPVNTLLLESSNVSGPWSTNAQATSPFQIVPTRAQMFYRLQKQ